MAKDSKVSWVVNGRLTHVLPAKICTGATESDLLQKNGAVKIIESCDGVEIKWSVFSANWASLFFLSEWVHTRVGPFKLVYFLSGWFEETRHTPDDAASRISEIQAKSDVHITQHTFVKAVDPDMTRVPHVLRDILNDGIAPPDLSVDCFPDDSAGQFGVARIGKESTIARLWGLNPVSFPCLTGHSYGQIVSQAYREVVEEDVPRYDQVLAAMTTSDSKIVWIPYHRVILPHRFPDRRKGVTVVTEIDSVDIKII